MIGIACLISRPASVAGLSLLLAGCTGPVSELTTIPAQEAAWRQVEPELVGMTGPEVERCAGPPRSAAMAPGGATALVYRAQDLKNYCEVTLLLRNGRVASLTADHAAPESLFLRDGSNYCGQIFQACLR
jgi:hypothetical protein